MSLPPPESSSNQPAPRRAALGWPGWLSWAVILLVAGLIIVRNADPELLGQHAATAANEQMQMNLLGKYTLGVARWKPDSAKQLLQQVEPHATTPAARLELAILAGEILGKDGALSRVDALLAAQPDKTVQTDAASIRGIYADGAGAERGLDRDGLIGRYGFFGRLALAFGKPDIDPQRQAVLNDAKSSATAYISFLVGGGIMLLVGLVLLIVAIVLVSIGQIKTKYVPASTGSSAFVEIFAVYLFLFVAFGIAVRRAMPNAGALSASWLLTPVLPLAVAWGWFRGTSWAELRNGLGWQRGRGWLVEVPLGVVGYITGLPVVAAGFCLSLLLMQMTGAKPGHPIQNELASTPAWQLYAIAAVWAPIIEESMFRGALFHHLRRRWGWAFSAGTVALIFAAIHPQGLTFIPVLGSIALVLAGIREWRGTLIPSVIAHGLNNATILTLMLLTM